MNNAELLATIRQEISRMLKDNSPYFDVQERTGAHIALAKLSSFLDSLAVDSPEVDLEKELENFVKSEIPYGKDGYGDMLTIATHFYKLGKNAK